MKGPLRQERRVWRGADRAEDENAACAEPDGAENRCWHSLLKENDNDYHLYFTPFPMHVKREGKKIFRGRL